MNLNRWGARSFWVAGATVFFFLPGCGSSPGETSSIALPQPAPQPARFPDNDLPQVLARLDGVASDATKVERYRVLLGKLDDTYTDNKQQISDMTVVAREQIEKRGKSDSLLQIMETMNKVFPPGKKGFKYAEYSALYVTLRGKNSREDAEKQTVALVRSIGEPGYRNDARR